MRSRWTLWTCSVLPEWRYLGGVGEAEEVLGGHRVPGHVVHPFAFRVSGFGFRVSGFGLRVLGLGLSVQGLGLEGCKV